MTIAAPDRLDISFEGFREEAFETLGRLKSEPNIERYRLEKENLERYVTGPFRTFRDDLVLNWVLPNRLALETERNVFSRILKNDFGAGGSHHHQWLSFYRPGRRRLTDVQLAHGIYPDRFTVSVYVGGYAKDLLREARRRIAARGDEWLGLVNPLLERGDFSLHAEAGSGAATRVFETREPLDHVPDIFSRAGHIWVDHAFPRARVVAWGGRLVPESLAVVSLLWPIFVFWTD